MTEVNWIGVDWGTSNLRAWGMGADNTVVAEARSDAGMGTLPPEGFEAALIDLVGGWLGAGAMDVVVCGMAGSRQGWAEAPYRAVPCAAKTDTLTQVQTSDPRLRVHIVPGVKQAQPADVMRGEETQIAGFLALNPKWDGVICLPGTHTKWALVSAEEIVSFQSFMTGEMFALLAKQSILRHTVAADGWDSGAFDEALDDSLANPARLAARLFSLRAEALLAELDGVTARSRLSGALIGVELAAARPYWLGQQVAVIGADALSDAYVAALSRQGVQVVQLDVDAMTRAGLAAAHENVGAVT
ncbi:2-keto-3-deoxy-galactonokinase [Actibacterium lipolyticum]|uniref:2-keto-3-deoxy-galactonokinase n=2 Tax=Actibacterium lipolyticum TaxID=1524263 RepID=A0A238KJF0_9RHOB|nr:2-dehydro-3-deoxygalactonokinase [Actibacterium lipolyticum]SMX42913.1 2-keto-3-deoxy-galactonokinase [Actibacterium lipolyticum]